MLGVNAPVASAASRETLPPAVEPERLRFSQLFNLAGALTLLRLPLAVVTNHFMHNHVAFVGVFLLAMASDVLDGHVARWTKTQSEPAP